MRSMGSASFDALLSKLMEVCFNGGGGVPLVLLGNGRTLLLGGVLVLFGLRWALEEFDFNFAMVEE